MAGGRDVVVVTPDGGSRVARRLVERVTAALGADAVADVRGDTSPRLTYRRGCAARCGQVRVVVGERGVAFWPLERLGLAVVLDEANPALKERRSPRHHAREVLLERARRAGAVGLLVTTVPSAATWALLRERRLTPVVAPRADERHRAPRIQVDEDRTGPRTRLGRRALPALRRAVGGGAVRRSCWRPARGRARPWSARPAATGSAARPAGARSPRPAPSGSAGPAAGGSGPAAAPSAAPARSCPWRPGPNASAAELRRGIEDRAPVVVLEGHDQPVPPAPAVLVMTRGSVMDAPPGPVGAIVLGDLDALARRPPWTPPRTPCAWPWP